MKAEALKYNELELGERYLFKVILHSACLDENFPEDEITGKLISFSAHESLFNYVRFIFKVELDSGVYVWQHFIVDEDETNISLANYIEVYQTQGKLL